MRRALVCCLIVGFLLASCSSGARSGDQPIRVVASFYPLAWVSQQVGGGRVVVEDLTPPGGEAHDATLTAQQRADLDAADLITIQGTAGFQPVIEAAAGQASAPVVTLEGSGVRALQPATSGGLDPHLWLDRSAMAAYALDLGDALAEIDPPHSGEYLDRAKAVSHRIEAGAPADGDCLYGEIVTSHEAFAYLLRSFSSDGKPAVQVGVEGATPEGEPSADRVQAALTAIGSGAAPRVVFYEPTDEGRRIAQAVAADVGAEIAPLSPLETQPPAGDYLSVLHADEDTLTHWMECA